MSVKAIRRLMAHVKACCLLGCLEVVFERGREFGVDVMMRNRLTLTLL